MKKLFTLFFLTALVAAFPATRTFTGPGLFTDSSKWDTYPTTGDTLVISSGACTVAADITTVYGPLTVSAAGTFALGSYSVSVTAVSIGGALTMTQTVTTGLTCSDLVATSSSMSIGTGSVINFKGNLALADTALVNANSGIWNVTGSSGTQSVDFGAANPTLQAIVFACPVVTCYIIHNFQPLTMSGTGGIVLSSLAGTQRIIKVANTGVTTGMSFKDISAGSANKINAKVNCTNLGDTLGIVYKDTVR
jgi:hypothetical protein